MAYKCAAYMYCNELNDPITTVNVLYLEKVHF